MPPRIGYLLPTRERVMEGRPQTGPLLDLAARAEGLGFDSVWVGDSLLARPRHDPLTLLAAAAARTQKVQLGTAVFLPALRNPVVLAHQLATLDQISEGRLVLGAGIASDVPNIRAEFVAAGVPFEGRVGRMMEGLRLARALWTGKPVDWNGRWRVEGGVLGPTPYRAGGPPIWMAGSVRPALERAARHFDGWFANEASLARWTEQWGEVQAILREAGRDAGKLRRSGLRDPRDRRGCQPRRAADQRVSRELLRAAGRRHAPTPRLLRRPGRRCGRVSQRFRGCRRLPPDRALHRRP